MADARLEFASILDGDMNVCIEREVVMELPSMQSAYVLASRAKFDWFTDVFIDNKHEAARASRAIAAPNRFFKDLALLHYAQTGEPARLDYNLIGVLERRIMTAQYPSNYEVAIGATKHPAAVASRNIKRLITEAAWHG